MQLITRLAIEDDGGTRVMIPLGLQPLNLGPVNNKLMLLPTAYPLEGSCIGGRRFIVIPTRPPTEYKSMPNSVNVKLTPCFTTQDENRSEEPSLIVHWQRGDSMEPVVRPGDALAIVEQTSFTGDGYYLLTEDGLPVLRHVQNDRGALIASFTNTDYSSPSLRLSFRQFAAKTTGKAIGVVKRLA